MPYIAYIDTIDVCHLKCPTCIRGVGNMRNSARKMPLDLFEKIVAKIKAEQYERVGLYNWIEPFLNQTLDQYVAAIKEAGLACDISTTLSLRHVPQLERVLRASPDEIIVSISGADQETYQRNHIGAHLDYAVANLRRIREIMDRHGLSTIIRMRFLRFHYNHHAVAPVQALAAELGFRFELLEAGGDPDVDPPPLRNQTPELMEQLTNEAEALPLAAPEDATEVCPLGFEQMTVDCVGDAYLCDAFGNYKALKIGRYLDLSADELLVRKYRHAFCRACWLPRRAAYDQDRRRLAAAVARYDARPREPVLS